MGAYTMQRGSLYMRKSKRLVVPLAVFALVAAGGIGLGLTQVADAQPATSCPASATTAGPVNCTAGPVTINDPITITLVVDLTAGDTATSTTTPDQDVVVSWTGDCSQNGNDLPISGTSATTPINLESTPDVSVSVPFPTGQTTPDFCDITAGAELEVLTGSTPSTTTTGAFTLDVDDTATASSSAATTSSSVDVAYISGHGGKCLDDRGNSSSNGAEVIIWGCNHGDSAQSWSWSGYELKHDGKCVNDPGYGGSGSKVILYSCNGGSNEKWSHVSGGEFKLFYSSKGQLCLDDPGYSTTNGTRLSVYKCNNGGNQHWSRS
jgi:hypothetical protein